jgi:hypothetical protein
MKTRKRAAHLGHTISDDGRPVRVTYSNGKLLFRVKHSRIVRECTLADAWQLARGQMSLPLA